MRQNFQSIIDAGWAEFGIRSIKKGIFCEFYMPGETAYRSKMVSSLVNARTWYGHVFSGGEHFMIQGSKAKVASWCISAALGEVAWYQLPKGLSQVKRVKSVTTA